MGKAVARNADIALLTSDNPRTEDPSNILRGVEKGLRSLRHYELTELPFCNSGYTRVLDRKDAILAAVSLAKPNDTIVIAGKGHEDYQIIGTRRYPFDDREEAREALRKSVL
jgi:UDP-N-acetylmuramoyl-L-alanyl-D-glutamate--2,6-diaminopimelate ligase